MHTIYFNILRLRVFPLSVPVTCVGFTHQAILELLTVEHYLIGFASERECVYCAIRTEYWELT